MPNPNPKLENLTSYKPKWQSGKTRTIRVPIAIADRVLELAHQIDEGKLLDTSDSNQKDSLSDRSNKSLENSQDNMTDTSEKLDRERLQNILTEAVAIPSHKGGQIKEHLAKLAKILGFEMKRNNIKQWTITDTSK